MLPLLEENDTNNVVCNLCQKVMRGGITRAKQYLMGKKVMFLLVTNVQNKLKDELREYFKEKKRQEHDEVPNVRQFDLEPSLL